jgi:hypothetical protein
MDLPYFGTFSRTEADGRNKKTDKKRHNLKEVDKRDKKIKKDFVEKIRNFKTIIFKSLCLRIE